ncbi:hypothetical protein ACFZDK_33865 [Streptomyces sp. NPDC007901]|uniref:hypothetical protein n=1 Tax=Streptomyces sp. NPDC007901 TaxID=3364785 RepID=UPI0036E219A6
MSEIADIAVGFPVIVFTTVLVVVLGLWLLVLLGTAGRDSSYDAVNLPVAAAASAVVALSWLLSTAGSLALRRIELAGPWYALATLAVLGASPTLAYMAIRRATRAWRERSARDATGRDGTQNG